MKYLLGFLVALVIVLTSSLAYFVGRGNLKLPFLPDNSAGVPSSPLPAETVCTLDAKICPDGSSVGREGPNCEFAACPTVKTQTVRGGGVLSFPRYELTVGADWTVSRETPGPDSERLVLRNGDLGLTILQGGFGGSVCLYPGDADSEGPSARYTKYVELVNKSGDKFRRSTPESGQGFALCQLSQYGWGAPTLYGAISLVLPTAPTPVMIDELDQALKSLTKL